MFCVEPAALADARCWQPNDCLPPAGTGWGGAASVMRRPSEPAAEATPAPAQPVVALGGATQVARFPAPGADEPPRTAIGERPFEILSATPLGAAQGASGDPGLMDMHGLS